MDCLLVIDAQYDFMPGGNLPVPEGDKIIPVINKMIDEFPLIIFSKDWHPKNHCSFKENGGIWPVHCVRNTHGAEIHKDIMAPASQTEFILKGSDIDIDSYSAFYDNERKKSTNLTKLLIDVYIDEVYCCGLAIDYCVKFSAIDAIKEGFKTYVILDACRGVNINPSDVDNAIEEMKKNGIKMV
jgi:nicotinamidase/pyrazinamidase